MAVWYHQALDVFVVPRKDLDVTRSVTPLKPVEAMACAKPVVASRLPALAEIVEHEVTGLLTTPGNREELAGALRRLLDDSRLAAEFGQRGRTRVLKERTWSANTAALIEELETLGVSIR
jgi:glycosyltransferase involved in cell wall biosynthesis